MNMLVGSCSVGLNSAIIDGPDFTEFIRAALKGSIKTATFVVPSADGEDDVNVEVAFSKVELAEEPGYHFDYEGTALGRKVKGRFTLDHMNHGGRRGNVEFV